MYKAIPENPLHKYVSESFGWFCVKLHSYQRKFVYLEDFWSIQNQKDKNSIEFFASACELTSDSKIYNLFIYCPNPYTKSKRRKEYVHIILLQSNK